MSYYQYYEFLAMDRPLSEADKNALGRLSSRANITSNSFAVHYDYGDFRGNEKELLTSCFDMHLYLADGGARRLMILLPAQFATRTTFESIIGDCDFAEFVDIGEGSILDIGVYEDEADYEDWEEGPGWLDALAPLRYDLLSGDLRLAYLIWLASTEWDMLEDDIREPLSGIGPLTKSLEEFGNFFGINRDLVQAAAEATTGSDCGEVSPETALAALKTMPDEEKAKLLHRFLIGDPLALSDLKASVRPSKTMNLGEGKSRLRTLRELRALADKKREERLAARERAKEEKRRQRQQELEEERKKRLERLRKIGDEAWGIIEEELAARTGKSYDRALELVLDLRALAEEKGKLSGFFKRLDTIRFAHHEKKAFIRRLDNSPVLCVDGDLFPSLCHRNLEVP
ncbi:MAG: WVD2 family protein [Roseovarius sp.]|nr:WVD2 family protein [Roseovarius sp.]